MAKDADIDVYHVRFRHSSRRRSNAASGRPFAPTAGASHGQKKMATKAGTQWLAHGLYEQTVMTDRVGRPQIKRKVLPGGGDSKDEGGRNPHFVIFIKIYNFLKETVRASQYTILDSCNTHFYAFPGLVSQEGKPIVR